MFFAKRCLIGSLLIFGGLVSACAAQQAPSKSGSEVVAYRLQIFNESTENIRYQYARLVPHQEPTLPQDPAPQATLDIGIVSETLAPGESTVVTLKPGRKLMLTSPGPKGTQRTEVIADASLRLYVTQEGVYRQENDDSVRIRIDG